MTHSLRILSAYVQIHDFLVHNDAKVKITVNANGKELCYEPSSCSGVCELAYMLTYHMQQDIDKAKMESHDE